MDILTTATQTYLQAFAQMVNQFLQWGQWLFFGLLTLNLTFLFLGYAFDRDSFVDSTAQFIRKFFVIAFFYTLMLHHGWLLQLLKSAQVMGHTLTGAQTDPSSLVAQGIGLANKVIYPVQSKGLLTIGFGALVILIVYVVILFSFIAVALQLAVTLMNATALITVSTFFLGFAALSATSQIARNTLDVLLANCVRLLGIYLVVAAGSHTLGQLENYIPTQVGSLDIYSWLAASTLLFWLLTKNLPEQLARLVSGAIQEVRGQDAASMAIATVQTARNVSEIQSHLASIGGGLAKGTVKGVKGALSGGSQGYNQARSAGLSPAASTVKGAVGAVKGAHTAVSTVSGHFRQGLAPSGGASVSTSTVPDPSAASPSTAPTPAEAPHGSSVTSGAVPSDASTGNTSTTPPKPSSTVSTPPSDTVQRKSP